MNVLIYISKAWSRSSKASIPTRKLCEWFLCCSMLSMNMWTYKCMPNTTLCVSGKINVLFYIFLFFYLFYLPLSTYMDLEHHRGWDHLVHHGPIVDPQVQSNGRLSIINISFLILSSPKSTESTPFQTFRQQTPLHSGQTSTNQLSILFNPSRPFIVIWALSTETVDPRFIDFDVKPLIEWVHLRWDLSHVEYDDMEIGMSLKHQPVLNSSC